MPTALAIPVFFASLAGTLLAASFFAKRLDRVGLRLGLPETMLGLLTALAADAPEVSSAIAALVQGAHGVAVGVVVGSNAFNLAAMVGLSAVLAGGITVRREALVLEGFVGVWVTAIVTALVAGALGSATALALLAAVVGPYVGLLALGPRGVLRLPLEHVAARFLRRTFGEGHRPLERRHSHGEAILRPALLLLPALAIIVAGSAGMVTSALDVADRWSVPRSLVGVLVLAVLTSIPNASTAIRLGLQHRGAALTSETLNSNSINLVAGIAIPAAFVSVGTLSALVAFDLAWLLLMTAATLLLLGRSGGAGRSAGGMLIALYAVFVAVQVGARI
jgi:cation:H+ antiporter